MLYLLLTTRRYKKKSLTLRTGFVSACSRRPSDLVGLDETKHTLFFPAPQSNGKRRVRWKNRVSDIGFHQKLPHPLLVHHRASSDVSEFSFFLAKLITDFRPPPSLPLWRSETGPRYPVGGVATEAYTHSPVLGMALGLRLWSLTLIIINTLVGL